MRTSPGPVVVQRAAPARYVDHVMGMPVSLALRGAHRDDRLAMHAWEEVMAELREADELFSTYRTGSWVSRWNRGEAPASHPLVEEVLAIGEEATRASGGAFTVHVPGPGGEIRLDPSGVVKGWAVGRASRHLRTLDDTDFCLSVAGDMQCHVTSHSSPVWRVGVTDPRHPRRLLTTVDVRDGGVATSGTGARGAHVVDGRTGRASAGVSQVTVVAATVLEADLRATAALALGRDARGWLAGLPGTRAFLVPDDGSPHVTVGE